MISLKRNGKGELVEAKGLRTRSSTIYKPNQKEDFAISRGKFSDFLNCPRCFYIDRVTGIISPGTPGWTLNALTDTLLKDEFDECRKKQKPHRILIQNNLSHIVPFQHDDIDKWRDSLHYGLKSRFKDTNIILKGGIDDVWINTKTNELIVADYKSQQSNYDVSQATYFNSPYKDGYKKQLDFYGYLLKEMGFKVSKDSYLYICNAINQNKGFNGKMIFEEVLIHYQIDTSYLEDQIQNMINVLNSIKPPSSNNSCENCAYSKARSDLKL
tara:strand:- start:1679 stop:2488 length:810 start_codon:yes stop_codon:yes gene_type:complete